MTAESIARLCAFIAAIGIIINALELLVDRHEIFGFFSWSIIRTRYYGLLAAPRTMSAVSALFSAKPFCLLLATQAIAAAFVPIVFRRVGLALCLIAIVFFTHLMIHFRLLYGLDGSDQMHTVVWGALLVFRLSSSSVVQEVALMFLAGQLILAYETAGIAKAISPTWRGGQAIALIFRTRAYGGEHLLRWVERYRLSKPLSWLTITFEVGGPLLILLGPRGALLFLVGAVCFHTGIAMTMGLNSFVWAFCATLPAVYYVSQWLGL